MGTVMVLEKMVDFPGDPGGLHGIFGTDNNQVFGIVQGVLNLGRQVAGGVKLFLVPEYHTQPLFSAVLEAPGNAVLFNEGVQLFCYGRIQFRMAVADKSNILFCQKHRSFLKFVLVTILRVWEKKVNVCGFLGFPKAVFVILSRKRQTAKGILIKK